MSLYIVYENYVFCPFSRFVRGCGKLLYRACLRVMELPLNYLMFVLINVFNVVNFLALDELLIFVILLIFWMENKVFAQKKKIMRKTKQNLSRKRSRWRTSCLWSNAWVLHPMLVMSLYPSTAMSFNPISGWLRKQWRGWLNSLAIRILEREQRGSRVLVAEILIAKQIWYRRYIF